MPGPRPQGQKTKLALAIAEGIAVAAWARQNQVPKRTAYTWAKEPKVKKAIESYRRRAVDRAIGRMSKHSTWAAQGVVQLARAAESESVKLSALRAILRDRMALANFAELEGRMTQIEEHLRERTGDSDRTG